MPFTPRLAGEALTLAPRMLIVPPALVRFAPAPSRWFTLIVALAPALRVPVKPALLLGVRDVSGAVPRVSVAAPGAVTFRLPDPVRLPVIAKLLAVPVDWNWRRAMVDVVLAWAVIVPE